jgi:hypothetical protein
MGDLAPFQMCAGRQKRLAACALKQDSTREMTAECVETRAQHRRNIARFAADLLNSPTFTASGRRRCMQYKNDTQCVLKKGDKYLSPFS